MPRKQAHQRRPLLVVGWIDSAVRTPATMEVVDATCSLSAGWVEDEQIEETGCRGGNALRF